MAFCDSIFTLIAATKARKATASSRIHLATHAAAIRAHVNSLGNKAYWAQFPDAPDYVVMFIPGEHFLSAALEQDSPYHKASYPGLPGLVGRLVRSTMVGR